MAAGMVVGRLDVLPGARRSAAPDFRTFQCMFREADQLMGPTPGSKVLRCRFVESPEFGQIAAEAGVPANAQAGPDGRRSKLSHQMLEPDLDVLIRNRVIRSVRLLDCGAASASSLGFEGPQVVLLLRRKTNNKSNNIRTDEDIPISYPHAWEASICWGSGSGSEGGRQGEDEDDVPPSHDGVRRGTWINAILWNDTMIDLDSMTISIAFEELYRPVDFRVPVGALLSAAGVSLPSSRVNNELVRGFRLSSNDTSANLLSEVTLVAQNAELVDADVDEEEPSFLDADDAAIARAQQQQEEGGQPSGSASALSKLEKTTRQHQSKLDRLRKVTGLGDVTQNLTSVYATGEGNSGVSGADGKRKQKIAVSAVENSLVALKHEAVKFSLRPMELRHFHRPRLARMWHSWSVTVEGSSGTARRTTSVLARLQGRANPSKSQEEGRLDSTKVTDYGGHRKGVTVHRIDSANDLCLFSGGSFVCLEYVEERPHVLLSVGMASKMVNYFRVSAANQSEGSKSENNSAFFPSQNGVANSAEFSDGSVAPQPRGRTPRHMMGLKSQLSGKHLIAGQTLLNDSDVDAPQYPEGVTELLDADDTFPFIGNLEEGKSVQTLKNNLFRAPMFKHRPRSSDFLLVRNAAVLGEYHFSIREIPCVFLVGQQEPLEIVERPFRKKQMSQFLANFTTYHLMKFFNTHGHSAVELSEIQKKFQWVFTRYKDNFRQCLARVADESEDGQFWQRKLSHELYEEDEISELEKSFSPEDVCLHESQVSYEYRLSRWGIDTCLETSKLEQCLGVMVRVKQVREAMRQIVEGRLQQLMLAQDPLSSKYALVLQYINASIERMTSRIYVGRFIHERLLISPWNITESFVKVHIQKQGTGRLQLTGPPGDPSGRGEGFSFCREAKLDYGKGKAEESIVESDRDLRKLNMKEVNETLINFVKPEVLKPLKRWDRIHLIREIANISAQNGFHDPILSKYVRSTRVNTVGQLIDYQKKCTEIWNRQIDALSRTDEEAESEGEEMDEDDFADSLDNELSEQRQGFDYKGSAAIRSVAFAAATASISSKSNLSDGKAKPPPPSAKSKASVESDEMREMMQLRQILESKQPVSSSNEGPSASKTADIVTRGPAAASSDNSATRLFSERPQRVVKRITRSINTEGEELISVQYLVSDSEVVRVEREQNKRQRDLQKMNEGFAAAAPRGRPSMQTILARGARVPTKKRSAADTARKGEFEDEEGDFDTYEDPGAIVLKLRKVSKTASNDDASAAMRRAREADLGLLDEEAEFLRRNKNRTIKSNVKRNLRLPHIQFAVTLEDQIMRLWNNKTFFIFRNPVDASLVPRYYSVVKAPMCLIDIRRNLAKFKYKSTASFLDDVELIHSNSELFNGPTHEITVAAKKLVGEMQSLLSVERRTLGADKDTFTVQQNDIRTKFQQLKRSLNLGPSI